MIGRPLPAVRSIEVANTGSTTVAESRPIVLSRAALAD